MAEGVPDLIIPIRMDADEDDGGSCEARRSRQENRRRCRRRQRERQEGTSRIIEGGASSAANRCSSSVESAARLQRDRIGRHRRSASEFKRACRLREGSRERLRRAPEDHAGASDPEVRPTRTNSRSRKRRRPSNSDLRPTENRDFQTEFMNYAGIQVGTDEETGGVAEGAKLTDEQARRIRRPSRGIDEIAPALTRGRRRARRDLCSKTPRARRMSTSSMQEIRRTFIRARERPRSARASCFPQHTPRSWRHGIASEEAAKLFSIASPAAPGQEGNTVESALKAIEEMKAESKGEEFGVKRGMGQI